jgi:hypothetical protein
MNSLPFGSDEVMANKGNGRRRAEQIQEADEIFEWLIFQRALAGDLIHAGAKTISDAAEASDVRWDLYVIARNLAAVTGHESPKAVWQNYQHHFIGAQKRKQFFGKLRLQARRVASAVLRSTWEPEHKTNLAKLRRLAKRLPSARLRKIRKPKHKTKDDVDPALPWDSSLLPKSIAPQVLRLEILHPGVLERFLPRFFVRASDCLGEESTYRRALLILHAVPLIGWSAEKHTKRLIELGSIGLSAAASEVETIKKFIRDLRHRHKKAHWPHDKVARQTSQGTP